MDDATITFVVLGAAVALFVWNRLPVAIVALGAALALYATGVIGVAQAFAGFGDPAVIFIASLFVISEALDATGVTTWAGQRLIVAAGDGGMRLSGYLLLLAAGLAAILTPNGAVAALLPMAVLIARRLGRAPSKLLMPMAFAAYAGALLVLTGSPVNVLVTEQAEQEGAGGFGFFAFAAVGVPLSLGVIAIALLLGPRLLPERRPRALSVDLSDHARTLLAQYAVDRAPSRHAAPDALFSRRAGVAEVIVPPRSPLVGETFFPGMVTQQRRPRRPRHPAAGRGRRPAATSCSRSATACCWRARGTRSRSNSTTRSSWSTRPPRSGVRWSRSGPARAGRWSSRRRDGGGARGGGRPGRGGRRRGGERARAARRARHRSRPTARSRGPPSSSSPGSSRSPPRCRRPGPRTGSPPSCSTWSGTPAPTSSSSGCSRWPPRSASPSATPPRRSSSSPSPSRAAETLDISVRPVLMSVAVACSASFLTPISTPGNLMIMGPAGYRFGDYWKLGVPMLGLFFVVAVFLVPVVWSF